MVEINWTPQSIRDIEQIASFISKDSKRYAEIQVHRFFDCVTILHQNPKTGRVVPEINNQMIRELILGNYRMIYKIVHSKQIDILSVHQSARRLNLDL